jgi:molecular chaperone GrpE
MKEDKKTQSVKKQNTSKKEEELREKIKELALTIDKVEDEKLVIINQLKKALADYQNLEANTDRRLGFLYLQSRKSLAEKLIPVIDALTMAIKTKENIKFDEKTLAWANGVVETFNNLEKSLEEIGLKKFVPQKGTKFDPSQHEALSTVDGDIPGIIYDVILPGYMLDDIVVRPSKVVVTKEKKDK